MRLGTHGTLQVLEKTIIYFSQILSNLLWWVWIERWVIWQIGYLSMCSLEEHIDKYPRHKWYYIRIGFCNMMITFIECGITQDVSVKPGKFRLPKNQWRGNIFLISIFSHFVFLSPPPIPSQFYSILLYFIFFSSISHFVCDWSCKISDFIRSQNGTWLPFCFFGFWAHSTLNIRHSIKVKSLSFP